MAVAGDALQRGSVALCMAVSAADKRTLATIRSVLGSCDAATPFVLAGSEESLKPARDVADDRLLLAPTPAEGISALLNRAAEVCAPADIALVASGIGVAAGWLARLRAAATEDSIVAAATPLSLGVGGVELLPAGDIDRAGVPTAAELEQRAAAVARSALGVRPRIAALGPGCAYIRRSAWELAGPLEPELPLALALERLATRLTALGLLCVVADDVLVLGCEEAPAAWVKSPAGSDGPGVEAARTAISPGQDVTTSPEQDVAVLDERGPLRRALDRGRTALGRLSVTIDARSLTSAVGGTQTYVAGLIFALAEEGSVAVRALVAHDLPAAVLDLIERAPGVELLSYEDALRDPPLSDVVHRPQQVFSPEDLALLRLVGRRIVIGQQDLIAYHNHTYHRDLDGWLAYRRTTRLAMAAADQVVFFSEHARRDALAEDLLQPSRGHVVGIGVDPPAPPQDRGRAPEGLGGEDAFLLCLGADYAHKNRPFAIELLGALRQRDWDGALVLAGAHVEHGSSRERERELLASDPGLAARVIELGSVPEPVKLWLYEHARALLYPTLYEGFGLIPLEAARMGLPCLFAAQASLGEIAAEAATLVPWDAADSAEIVLALLHDGPAREEHLRRLRAVAAPSWSDVAGELIAVYEKALGEPAPQAAPRAWQELDRERLIVRLDDEKTQLQAIAQEYQDAYHALEERVRVGLPLVDRGGLLSHDQQRGLMRIAGRGRLGAALLAPFGLLGRGGGEG